MDRIIANLNVKNLFLPADRSTLAASETTGVDITEYDGDIAVIVNVAVGTGTNPTFDLKLRTCDTVGGTYVDIPGAAITQVTDAAAGALNRQKLIIDANKCKAFINAAITITGSSPHFISGAVIVGSKQYN
jgi:hypothetical protein